MSTLIDRLLQEALAVHLEKPVRHVVGPKCHFVADFSSRGLALMRELFEMEPEWINAELDQEVAVFSKDGIVLELN